MSTNSERIANARIKEIGNISSRSSIADPQKYAINQNEFDCVSCLKHIHGIPKKKLCQAVCKA